MLSAGAFISNPGWIYTEGLLAGASNLTIPLCIVFCTCTILPILYHSKVTTMGQFVNMRFGVRTRMVAIIVWLLNSFVLIGGFIYTPALVLQSITGISLNVWVPVTMIVAIIYTISGGIKAVIWTDTLQGVVLAIGAVVALIVAFSNLDQSFGEVMTLAAAVGKTISFDFDFRMDNYNIVLCVIGSFVMWVSYFGFNQEQIQRYVTARSVRDVKKTGILSTLLMVGIYWMTYILGLVLYAFYQNNPMSWILPTPTTSLWTSSCTTCPAAWWAIDIRIGSPRPCPPWTRSSTPPRPCLSRISTSPIWPRGRRGPP